MGRKNSVSYLWYMRGCSLRRTMCQTVQESIQEMELSHQDPTQVVLHATRKRSVDAFSCNSKIEGG